MNKNNELLSLVSSAFRFRTYLLYKLPAAFFSGIKVREIAIEKCTTSVPYKWLTQNPFRSTYFASLAMAAEMSTGVLAMIITYKKHPAVSMLVVKMEANYYKKATSTIYFTCEEGLLIKNTVNEAIDTGDGKTITVKSVGKNKSDELIAEFFFTWSFKIKKTA